MNGDDPRDKGLRAYADFFAAIRPDRVEELRGHCTPDVRFRDPFNETRGIEPMLRIFRKMYEDADDIRFEIVDIMRRGDRGMLLWRFWFRPKSLKLREPWQVEGVSEIHLTPEGRVAAHLDHWDSGSQFYARLPLVGAIIRFVKRRLHAD